MSQPTIAISAESLLSLPIDVLIALYNAESRRLAGTLDAHLVDSSCKPLYIVKLMAKLPIRYSMMDNEASNERAAMVPASVESAERAPSEAERAREAMPLTKADSAFHLMR